MLKNDKGRHYLFSSQFSGSALHIDYCPSNHEIVKGIGKDFSFVHGGMRQV